MVEIIVFVAFWSLKIFTFYTKRLNTLRIIFPVGNVLLLVVFPIPFLFIQPIMFIALMTFSYLFSRRVVFHSHTFVSHDSDLSLVDYMTHTKYRRIYLTDHEQDIDNEKRQKLAEEVIVGNEKSGFKKFVQGAELNFGRQHILLHRIDDYELNKQDLRYYRKERLIWAHPLLSLRNPVNSLRTFFTIAFSVDGIEFHNIKMAKRGSYFYLQNFGWAVIGTLLFSLIPTFGHDYHELSSAS